MKLTDTNTCQCMVSSFSKEMFKMKKKLIVHGTLIDGNGGAPLEDSAILIIGERIEKVCKYFDMENVEDAEIIDATGKFIIPGLIEGHAHTSNFAAIPVLQKSLQRGITSVASVCAGKVGIELRDAIATNKLTGCAKLIAGCIVTPTHGHVKDYQMGPADGPWEVRRMVRDFADCEADFIKTAASGGFWAKNEICSVRNYTLEELYALADEAHAWHIKCVVHAHTQPGINNSIEAGIDQIHHGAFIDRDGVEKIKEKGLFYMPTLRVTSVRNADAWPDRPWMRDEMIEANPIHREGVKYARELGVKIMVGTDYPGSAREWEVGESTSYEMMEMQKCGYTPMELIVAATKTNAEGYGKDKDIGTIEAGKIADIVILNETPLDDISVLHKKETIACVLRDGIVEYADLNYKKHFILSYYR